MHRLVILQGGQAIPYELTKPVTILGRLPESELQLDSNMVSRRHAKVFQQGDGYVIEDLGSGNGTFVNGKKTEGAVLLKHGDRLKLGPMLLRYESGNGEDSVSPSSISSPAAFQVDVAEENESATIMGVGDNASGFGLLEVRPESKLKAIIEISRSLAGTVDLDILLPKILDTLFSIFPHADRGCILLKDDSSGQMVPHAIKHRGNSDDDDSVKLSRTILNAVLDEKKGILSADAASDSRFDASESISNLTIRSMMCVPMLDLQGEPLGIINIDTQNPVKQFVQEDLDLLLAVAGQAALSYESAKLMVSYAEKQKQDSEMAIARNVQHALLPEDLPDIEGYELFASYEAAQAVGGDYYDIIPLEDNKICLAFGDVAGKGVAAALVMARLSSVVRSTMIFVKDVQQAISEINNHMCVKACEGRFVTFVLMILDLKTNELHVSNAGHMSPMSRLPDKSIEEFPEDTVGLPIGVMEDFPYEAVSRTLEPGEIVTVYTDGVSEAMNYENELFGMEHLREFVATSPDNATELGKSVLADVKRHANGRPQNDDITLMSFGRKK